MRSFLAICMTGLLAASTFGAINFSFVVTNSSNQPLTSPITVQQGAVYNVILMGQCDTSGLLAVGGDILPDVNLPANLQTISAFHWNVPATKDDTAAQNWVPQQVKTVGTVVTPSFAGVVPTPTYDLDFLGNPSVLTGWIYSTAHVAAQDSETIDSANTDPVFSVGGWGGWNTGGVIDNVNAAGGITVLGSGQFPPLSTGGDVVSSFAQSGPKPLGYYQVQCVSTAFDTVSLNFVNAAQVGGVDVGYEGWFTTGCTAGDTGPVASTPVVFAGTGGSSNVSLVPAQGKPLDGQSLWRTSKNIIRLQFDGNITAPAAGQIQIVQCLAGGVAGTDVTSNWNIAVDPTNPTVLRLQEIGATTMVNRQWYAVRTNGWTGVNDFHQAFFLIQGDVNRDGKFNTNDVSLQLQQPNGLNKPDDYVYDLDGSKSVNTNDVNAIFHCANALTPARPSGW